MKYLLIVNPRSGKQDAEKKLGKVLKFFRKRGLALEVRRTEYSGHAAEIARAAAGQDWDVVIGAGGDGTLNEVLTGLGRSGKRLALLPWGTGNVFAHEMQFPRRLKKLCKMILRGRTAVLDTGVCGDRRFLLMLSTGFDAYSLRQIEAEQGKKKWGVLAYAWAGLKAFFRYRYPVIQADFGNGMVEKGSFVLISNTSRYGAFFSLTPQADPADGFFDVMVYQDTGTFGLLKLVVRLLWSFFTLNRSRGRRLFLKKKSYLRVRSVHLSSEGRAFTQIDGEFFGELPIKVEMDPRSVEVILPKKAAKRWGRAGREE